MNNIDTGLGVITVFFLVVLAILWFFLPFAIFGTKALIQESIDEQKALRKSIDDLHKTIKEKM
jgi:hypothetical protein